MIGVLCVVFYASAISPAVGLIKPVIVPRDAAIMSLMLAVGALITVLCKVNLGDVAGTSVFKSGMVACICVLGVAWLGDTFVSGHTKEIKDFAAQTTSIRHCLRLYSFKQRCFCILRRLQLRQSLRQ